MYFDLLCRLQWQDACYDVTWSEAAGNVLVVATGNGTIVLWDTLQPQVRPSYSTHSWLAVSIPGMFTPRSLCRGVQRSVGLVPTTCSCDLSIMGPLCPAGIFRATTWLK